MAGAELCALTDCDEKVVLYPSEVAEAGGRLYQTSVITTTKALQDIGKSKMKEESRVERLSRRVW